MTTTRPDTFRSIESRSQNSLGKNRRVIVTHADSPMGCRLIASLHRDPQIERILAMGAGPPPGSFEKFLQSRDHRLSYARIDLTRHRPMKDLFRSSLIEEARIDTLVHIPAHGDPGGDKALLSGGFSERTAEARLVLQRALDLPGLKYLIVLGSAYVYRLAPGNANLLNESSELDLAPEVPAEIRCWIDCDMIFQNELHNRNLRIVLLRIPTVVGSEGGVYMNPCLSHPSPTRVRPLGFDPICALITDNDVALATHLAIQLEAQGIFNISGRENVPLSLLAHWTGTPTIPIPGSLMGMASRMAGLIGDQSLDTGLNGAHMRFGFSLDTNRAKRELGFEPSYRIDPARAGNGKIRLETAPI
jgi:nucleoside-diphosphate-sugar epimerase